MKTSGLFTVHSYSVKCKPNEITKLIIFGDVHRDSPNHANAAWQDFLKYAKAQKKALFLGMGDYVDSASTSERHCLAVTASSMHESTLKDLQDLADAKVELLAKELGFMNGRLIGLLNGNHYFSFSDGTNTDQRLCRLLDCKYLGVSAFVRVYFNNCGRKFSLDIWAHHGNSGGRLLGGSINRVDQMREHAEADLYCCGHDHKRMVVPATPRLYLNHSSRSGLDIKQRQQWLIRSGSFLASYEDGVSNYNVDAGRGPCSLGHVELLIALRNTGKQIMEFDIHGLT